MRGDKGKALALRRKGLSYNSINKKLGVPKSTLSDWFSKISWSQALRHDLTQKAFIKIYPQLRAMSIARALKWEKWREAARQEAKNDFPKLSKDTLFITGVIIYWGEGDKNPENPVRVSNIDPQMLRIFVKFLRDVCDLPEAKIKAHMILYPDLDEVVCKEYWTSSIGINRIYFNKTQVIHGRYKTRRLNYGISAVEVASRQLKEKLLIWIKEFSQIL